MFYGITNSPAVFQIMINYLFWDFINQEIVVVYMDNILIYIKDMEEYNKVIEEVLMILKDNSLFLKPEKCVWRMNKVEYIRMIISDEGVHMSSEKVNAIKAWKKLKNVREVRSFLGFANYYCYFIKDFAKIAKLLVQLTHKDIEWSWTSASQTAFDHLKKKFSEEPVLTHPDPSQPMRVDCNTSGIRIGAFLQVKKADNENWHLCAYYSKSFNPAKRNYDIYDRELLAIIRALDEWRHHLEGAKHEVEIRTDHKNLEYFKQPQKLTRWQARWVQILQNFWFKLGYIPGSANPPDILSRMDNLETGEKDNEEVTVLPPNLFKDRRQQLGHVLIEGKEKDILKNIRKSENYDEEIAELARELKAKGKKIVRGEEWELEDGLLLYGGKVYVPRDDKLRSQIITLHHDSPVVGHPGKWKTLELISRNYW